MFRKSHGVTPGNSEIPFLSFSKRSDSVEARYQPFTNIKQEKRKSIYIFLEMAVFRREEMLTNGSHFVND